MEKLGISIISKGSSLKSILQICLFPVTHPRQAQSEAAIYGSKVSGPRLDVLSLKASSNAGCCVAHLKLGVPAWITVWVTIAPQNHKEI